ncbi:MAG: NifU N-terminal domain-containing protein [Bacteroidota bacterium]|nr:NifU N-terminal domain-containing protein [Bacteroidota bacterium]
MKKYKVKYKIDQNDKFAIFNLSHELKIDKTIKFESIEDANNFPLVQKLFYLPFVKVVELSNLVIKLERFDILKWDDVIDEVGIEIENYLNSYDSDITLKNQNNKSVTLYAESTPNPNVIKFVSNKILAKKIYDFKENKLTKIDLIDALFKLDFINEIFITENYISITKIEDFEWNEKVSETKDLIKTYLKKKLNDFRNQLIEFSSNNKNKKIKSTDITSKKIIQILDEYVKPAVASDGGNILFDSYNKKNKVVNVILQGACSGCPSSTITLKNGIENILKEMLPGVVKNVIAINE